MNNDLHKLTLFPFNEENTLPIWFNLFSKSEIFYSVSKTGYSVKHKGKMTVCCLSKPISNIFINE